MENKSKVVNKMCSFYVSDWHLITMLLPYINSKLEKGVVIDTILENNISENIDIILSKIVLNEKSKNNIKNIKWEKTNLIKYSDIDSYLNDLVSMNKDNEIYVFVDGRYSYITAINENIDKWINKNIEKCLKNSVKINIVNCFEVMDFNTDINYILDKHTKIINTSGEKNIEDVFEGYRPNSIAN